MIGTTHSKPLHDGRIPDWLLLGPRAARHTGDAPLVPPEHMPGLRRWGGERHPDGWPREGERVPPDGLVWRRVSADGPVIEEPAGGDGRWPRWMYAATYLRTYGSFAGRLSLRCRGSYVLRVASRPVLSHFGWPRPLEKPPETAELRVPDGCHLVLLKLISYGQPFAFSVRLRDADGRPVDGRRPLAARTVPLQSMRLDVPARGKRRDSPERKPELCTCAAVEEGEPGPSMGTPRWASDAPAGAFRTADGRLERGGTTVHAGYTDSSLYLLWRGFNPRPPADPEPAPWLLDHCVAMLDAGHEHSDPAAVLINRRGEVWSPDVDCARVESEVEDDGEHWSALLRIPLEVLGVQGAPHTGERWGVNFMRVCPELSDGPAFWTFKRPHWDSQQFMPREPARSGETVDPHELYARPECYGHMEFGTPQVHTREVAVRHSLPGRPELQVKMKNDGGRGRLYAEAQAAGTAESWPEPMRHEATFDEVTADRMLKQGSSITMSVPLGDLPPGDYRVTYSLRVPGRAFRQRGSIPFRIPRELDLTPRDGEEAPERDDRVTSEADLVLADPLPAGLLFRAELPDGGAEAKVTWNGERLECSGQNGWLQAHVPVSAARRGNNRVVVSADRRVERMRVRLHERMRRDLGRGRTTYTVFPGEFDGEGVEIRAGAVEECPVSVDALPLLPAGNWNLPFLLDRPGAGAPGSHSDFELSVRAFNATGDEAPPDVAVNDMPLDIADTSSSRGGLDGSAVEMREFDYPVPREVAQNGLNVLVVDVPEPLLVQNVILRESNLDDPQVTGVPMEVVCGELFEVELFTASSRQLTGIDLPRGIEADFELPRELDEGINKLACRGTLPVSFGRGCLRLGDTSACFQSPRIVAGNSSLGRASDLPHFRVEAGPLQVHLAAARGRARRAGADGFTMSLMPGSMPHHSGEAAEKLEAMLGRAFFVGGAESHGAPQGDLPASYRREGLPRAETAVLAGEEGDVLRSGWWYDYPAVHAAACGLLAGPEFPGCGSPIYPRAGTGHFHGTPEGTFDVLPRDCPPHVAGGYRLLVMGYGADMDPAAVEELVCGEGAWLLVTADAREILERFGIRTGETKRTERVRFAGGGRFSGDDMGLESSGVTYQTVEPRPDTVHAVAEPEGGVFFGNWRRGEGRLFVLPTVHPEDAVPLLGQAMRCTVRSLPPVFRFSGGERVAFSVYPEDAEEWTLFCRDPGAGFPLCRIYLADMKFESASGTGECRLEAGEDALPVELDGAIASVFAARDLMMTAQNGEIYFDSLAPRPDGYEVLVRGRGAGKVTLLPLSGTVRSVEIGGEQQDCRQHPENSGAVTFELDATPCTRFQVKLTDDGNDGGQR